MPPGCSSWLSRRLQEELSGLGCTPCRTQSNASPVLASGSTLCPYHTAWAGSELVTYSGCLSLACLVVPAKLVFLSGSSARALVPSPPSWCKDLLLGAPARVTISPFSVYPSQRGPFRLRGSGLPLPRSLGPGTGSPLRVRLHHVFLMTVACCPPLLVGHPRQRQGATVRAGLLLWRNEACEAKCCDEWSQATPTQAGIHPPGPERPLSPSPGGRECPSKERHMT